MENEIVSNDDMEKSNDNILLCGCGFSKDFGGLLVCEIWEKLYNNKNINQFTKSKMLNFENYEDVFDELKDNDRKIFLKELASVFEDFDTEFTQGNSCINILETFFNLFVIENKLNYMFSLNQDLLVERVFLKDDNLANFKFPYTDFTLRVPVAKHQDQFTQGHTKYKFKDFDKTIRLTDTPEFQKINYLKIHGSFNWMHTDNYIVQVTGTQKQKHIQDSSILDKQLKVFQRILEKKRKIVIVGYGFHDPHINECLLKSIDIGSSLAIINLEDIDNFKKNRSLKEEDATKIRNAISKYYKCSFIDFLKKDKKNYFNNLKEFLES